MAREKTFLSGEKSVMRLVSDKGLDYLYYNAVKTSLVFANHILKGPGETEQR